MKCVVLAYHSMGCAAIGELLNAGFEIQAVFTHRDKAGENIWFDSVAEFAGSRGIPVYAPESINHPVWVNRIRALAPDLIFSAYYRDIVKPEILEIPRCVQERKRDRPQGRRQGAEAANRSDGSEGPGREGIGLLRAQEHEGPCNPNRDGLHFELAGMQETFYNRLPAQNGKSHLRRHPSSGKIRASPSFKH